MSERFALAGSLQGYRLIDRVEMVIVLALVLEAFTARSTQPHWTQSIMGLFDLRPCFFGLLENPPGIDSVSSHVLHSKLSRVPPFAHCSSWKSLMCKCWQQSLCHVVQFPWTCIKTKISRRTTGIFADRTYRVRTTTLGLFTYIQHKKPQHVIGPGKSRRLRILLLVYWPLEIR